MSIFNGKRVTGFSNAEEEIMGNVQVSRVCQSRCVFSNGE